ncbi:DUF3515 domain-containing protein [Rhodococcus triatomae]|uniref:DUF3515 domain-containing protein n=1 Tax=Rhodococcus triatomae TaxID=300028 RepID=A0A1G8EP76_9NOCA|nr:DUF3515 domain-containing protein [Rhodococcus triatomae]QNG19253.1 DUF3515 domain-containing protein [Rhodococcus triatomae]QNG24834.1 DUF3515 domain-containing protein [Rhodococcus triatomae]SDH71680.1 Protein of unknown function [Rhodococcus triatomae]
MPDSDDSTNDERSGAPAEGTADEPETPAPAPADSPPRRHPAVIATATALPVALVIGLIVAAVLANRDPDLGPVALGTVPAPQADSPECTAVIDSLPDEVGDFRRAELVDPAPDAAAAWQREDSEPIVLRCGLDRPLEFDQASPLQVVDGVQWFEVSGAAQGIEASSWFAVDRGVYVGVTIPGGAGPTPIQELSSVVQRSLPAQPLDPAPVAGP